MEILADPRKLATWRYENYYIARFNTCLGIFKTYLKFWKGQESLAFLRKGLAEEDCTILHAAGSKAEALHVSEGSVHQKRQGRRAERARQGAEGTAGWWQ